MIYPKYKGLAVLALALSTTVFGVGSADAQIQSAGGGWYVAGYGNVYGSFGQASVAQSRMYDQMKQQSAKSAQRDALVKRWGRPAVEKAEREAASGAVRSTNPSIVVTPAPVVRNYGVFRPSESIDTGKLLADGLADTPAEKALIKQIYSAARSAYDKQAAVIGWKNNLAGGLTFFTVTAMTVYRDADEPTAEAANNYFKAVNLALDEIPEFGKATNNDKEGFNNMLIGFSGLLLAGYTEGKQENNRETVESYRKLAGILIKLVLKTEPNNLKMENGQIVLK